LGLSGTWAVSVHEFPEHGVGIDVVLASEEVDSSHLIRTLTVLPKGQLSLPPQGESLPVVSLKDSDWFKQYMVAGKLQIEPKSVYEMFNKQSARRILTGHLLALRFYPLLRMKAIANKPDMAGMWDKEFKFYNGNPEVSLTNYTALNYKMLTDWLESAPSQVLALIEGVSPSTIRNRLHSARQAGVIGKPGSGKRSAVGDMARNK
jgi:hypothetical protein